MMREAERDGVAGNVCCRLDKCAKGAFGHEGIYGRDHCRRTEEPIGEDLEARVGRRRRAHDQVDIEISRVVAQPLPAIITCVVDDDTQSTDPGSSKAIKRSLDEWASANRH